MKPVVLTTGVFDVLHPAHVNLLARIKAEFPHHTLVVGVNGDRRARELKEFVLFSAAERKSLLEAIRCVDRVVIFEEDTPKELIGRLKPDVFVKGTDWAGKEIAEADVCAENGTDIVFVNSQDDGPRYSSSELKRSLNATTK